VNNLRYLRTKPHRTPPSPLFLSYWLVPGGPVREGCLAYLFPRYGKIFPLDDALGLSLRGAKAHPFATCAIFFRIDAIAMEGA